MTKSKYDDFLIAAHCALSFLENAHAFLIAETIAPLEAHLSLTGYQLIYRKKLPLNETLFVSLSTCPVRLELELELGRGWPPQGHSIINVHELLAIESSGAKLEFNCGIYTQGQRVLSCCVGNDLQQVVFIPAAYPALHYLTLF